ncbi:MAG: hypothetical protein ABEJ89_01190 [Haloarculaceae archaeon]
MDVPAEVDERTALRVATAGVVVPLATVAGVRGLVIAGLLPPAAVPLGLLVLPLFAALGVATIDALSDPLGIGGGGEVKFRDKIPERHHANFSPEKLDETVEEGDESLLRFRRYYLLYLLAVPAWTVLFGLL